MTRDQRGDPDLPPGPARDLVDLFRLLRHVSSLSLGQLAIKSGVSRSYLSEVLRGLKTPSPRVAQQIAQAFGADNDTVAKAIRLASEQAELNQHNKSRLRDAPAQPAAFPPAPAQPQPAPPPPPPPPPPARALKPSAWRVRVSRPRLLAAVAIAGLLTLVTAATVELAGRPVLVTGSATCQPARPVVGVWIAAASGQGDSGFAHLGAVAATSSAASTGPVTDYSFRLAHGGSYAVHVGCGGTARRWQSTNFSPLESRPAVRLRCDDRAGPGGVTATGACVAVTGGGG